LTSGPATRTYSKHQIRHLWRFFRFWTYLFNERPLRAGFSLLLSDEAFGRLGNFLGRPPQTSGGAGPFSPRGKVATQEVIPEGDLEDVQFHFLPPSIGPEDIERLGDAIERAGVTWTFVATEGVDWTAVQQAAAVAITFSSDLDLLYTDELYADETFPTYRPSQIGPHTLLSGNVVGRHYLLRNSSARLAGGLRGEHGTASEFDLFLRMMDEGARFGRYPFLIHAPQATSTDSDLLGATASALNRRTVPSLRTESRVPGVVSWHAYSVEPATIEILIPTRDRLDLLLRCVEQIERITTYAHYSITILNNGSVESSTLEYFATTRHKVVDCPGEFNYARIINRGAAQSTADFLLMLNNDTIVKTSNWLELLLGAALLDDVGVVGAKIIDEGNEIEHSGLALAPYPQHIRYGINIPSSWRDFAGIRNVSAVTGALHLVSRVKWLDLGGMDEDLAVLLNDVDLCLRAQLKGWHTVLQPAVTIQHFASSSRGRLNPTADREEFIGHWDIFREYEDPYFPAACALYGNRLIVGNKTKQLFRWPAVFKALLRRD
jgi:GT2 family glycosyltransferase